MILTERLVLRDLTLDDAATLSAIRSLPEVERYQGWSKFNLNKASTLIAKMLGHRLGQAGWHQLAVTLDGVMIGDCGLCIESDARLAKIGFTLTPETWGKGLGTELIVGLSDHAFAAFGLHRITASVDPRNFGSCKALEKAGYVQEALFRQSVWDKGEWANDAVFAKLAKL
jgi:RimJ/RimL family protein N-acetyltransferase